MKLSPEQLAAAVLEITINTGRSQIPMVDANYLQKNCFPDLSLGTIQRAASAARDAGFIYNAAYHGARRDWLPSMEFLIDEIKKLREGMKP